MIKTTLTVMFSLLAFSAQAANTPATGGTKDEQPKEPVSLSVDDSHQQMKNDAKSEAPMYHFSAGDALKLDASGYTFVAPDKLKGKKANFVQLIFKSNEQYTATWDSAKTSQILSKDTLTPARAKVPAFTGFTAGKEGVIAIGNNDGGKFNPFWVARFNVN